MTTQISPKLMNLWWISSCTNKSMNLANFTVIYFLFKLFSAITRVSQNPWQPFGWWGICRLSHVSGVST